MTITTFEDDLLGLSSFADGLEAFIRGESRFVAGGLVLGLNGRFGQGKSSFFRMWKQRMDAMNDSKVFQHVILLNAWESDYYGDPLFAIVSALIDAFTDEPGKSAAISSAVKDFGWFATAIANQVVTAATGIDAVQAGAFVASKQAGREQRLETLDAFSVFQARKQAMGRLKQAIAAALNEEKGQVLILVDELDRCRPDYAIQYLETIKHIFDIPCLVFLLGVDRAQLENSTANPPAGGLYCV